MDHFFNSCVQLPGDEESLGALLTAFHAAVATPSVALSSAQLQPVTMLGWRQRGQRRGNGKSMGNM